jgi:hypothetical protein
MAFFQKLAEVLLERVPTRSGQCNDIADGHASVFTRILQDFHGQFGDEAQNFWGDLEGGWLDHDTQLHPIRQTPKNTPIYTHYRNSSHTALRVAIRFPGVRIPIKLVAGNHFFRSVMKEKRLFVLGTENQLADLASK